MRLADHKQQGEAFEIVIVLLSAAMPARDPNRPLLAHEPNGNQGDRDAQYGGDKPPDRLW